MLGILSKVKEEIKKSETPDVDVHASLIITNTMLEEESLNRSNIKPHV
jgi:hypothetical protein